MNKLEEIMQHKRGEVARRKKERPVSSLQAARLYGRTPLSLTGSIGNADGFGIIAEFKRRSPSAGTIDAAGNPAESAVRYANRGAAGVSVLTDERYFGGSLEDLRQVRNAVDIPVLRKDFILDEYQLHEAKAYGADAVLLIADVLTKEELGNLFDRATGLGLECLVEVYGETNIDKIDFTKMKLIGINNRDLRTFSVDLGHTGALIGKLPRDTIVISESGIRSDADIERVRRYGARGALIGEWYMRNKKPFIKICGITNAEDALLATELGADAVGFIFYTESPRAVDPGAAGSIIGMLPARVRPVGVFVNHPREAIEKTVRETGIRTVQLHGDEQPEDTRFGSIPAWKAVRPRTDADLEPLGRYGVEAFVVDTPDRTLYGGTGRTGNWELARKAAQRHRVILAGGLGPDTITRAISTVQPFGVDVNSGVESAPGKKDRKKLESLFELLSL
jgi:indole-3-glycerol phosphate synthase / phosphoribosylanthranilate isomerase